MQHASDTNRKDRAQRAARRQKFNENRSEVISVDAESTIKVDFSNLTEEQIAEERERIQSVVKNRRKGQLIFIICAAIGLIVGISVLYSITITSAPMIQKFLRFQQDQGIEKAVILTA